MSKRHSRFKSGMEVDDTAPITLMAPAPGVVSGKLPMRKPRSLPHVSVFGGKCCRYECRIATPPPAIAKSTMRPEYALRPHPRGPWIATTSAVVPMAISA